MFDKEPPKWEGEDASAMRTFLESDSGKRFIARLAWFRPDFSPSYDATRRLVESGEIRGYERCIEQILLLKDEATVVKDEVISPNYPPLDSDHFWPTT